MKQLPTVLIITTVLLVSVIALLLYSQKNQVIVTDKNLPSPTIAKDQETIKPPTNPSIEEKTVPSTIPDWQPYFNTELSFQIIHPKDIVPEESNDDGSVKIMKLGPTQKPHTEFYDGFYVQFFKGNLGSNKDLLSLINADIEQKQQQLGSDFQIKKPVTPITVNDINGYTYETNEAFGSYAYYYLPQGGTRFLLVTTHVSDPGNLGFRATVDKIVNSITIL
jgi:hypothetical protein